MIDKKELTFEEEDYVLEEMRERNHRQELFTGGY
jgi:hypothetical protein